MGVCGSLPPPRIRRAVLECYKPPLRSDFRKVYGLACGATILWLWSDSSVGSARGPWTVAITNHSPQSALRFICKLTCTCASEALTRGMRGGDGGGGETSCCVQVAHKPYPIPPPPPQPRSQQPSLLHHTRRLLQHLACTQPVLCDETRPGVPGGVGGKGGGGRVCEGGQTSPTEPPE